MIATSLILLISFIICCILYFAWSGPRESWDPDLESGVLSILERRKDKLLRVLKDLDDEHEMGTIEKTEYLQLRRNYKARAVVALREFDRVREARLRRLKSGKGLASPALRAQIDKMARQRRQGAAPAAEGGK
jgi:hypothetical protein